jgi:rubredoxin
MATDPKADPDRRSPAQGDLRLLMTMVAGKPQAVLYRAVVPGTSADEEWTTSTSVGRTSFDRVERLTDAQMACADNGNGYIFEAAIPLERLGLDPAAAERIKLDWGILECGADGSEVLQRIYWSNKATSILADVALEAALHPELWGHARFSGADASRAAPSLDRLNAPGTNEEDLSDLLGE